MAMSLWFVTPAFRRYGLTAVCLEQRRRVVADLIAQGVHADCVVVADDENLDLARSLGFSTIERDNRWLGRKFNDGIQYALNHGADWIVPIGSDDWIDPDYLWPLPSGNARTSHYYAPVESDRLALVSIPTVEGAGPRVLHRSLFTSERPAEDRIRRGFDRSLLAGLGEIEWEYRDLHPLQYIGFRGELHITLYSKILRARGGEEQHDPWERLKTRYPEDLVESARTAMAHVRRPRAVGRLDAWGVRDRLIYWWGRFWPGEG
jgi:glycosyltransferase involved in cell wall biosynthesis